MSNNKNSYLVPLSLHIITFVIAGIGRAFLKDKMDENLLQIVYWLFVGLAFTGYIFYWGKGNWNLLRVKIPTIKQVLIILSLLMLSVAVNYVIAIYTENNGENIYKTLGIVATALAVRAIAEEIVYRGFLQTYFNRRIDRGRKGQLISWGNLFATTLMVLSHITFYVLVEPLLGTLNLILMFTFSLMAGYFRDKTHGIIIPIILHIMVNYVHILILIMFNS